MIDSLVFLIRDKFKQVKNPRIIQNRLHHIQEFHGEYMGKSFVVNINPNPWRSDLELMRAIKKNIAKIDRDYRGGGRWLPSALTPEKLEQSGS